MDENIKEFILESDLMSLEKVKEIENISFKKNISFFDAVLKEGFLDQEILSKISAHLMGIIEVSLKNYPIDLDTYQIIPELVSYENNIIAFKNNKKTVSVAFCDMKSLEILDSIFSTKPEELNIFLASKKDIEEHKKKYRKLIHEEFDLKSKNQLKRVKTLEKYAFDTEKDLPNEFVEEFLNDNNIDDFINSLLEHAIFSRASFIYINNNGENIKISFRIFGKNYKVIEVNNNIYFSLFSKLKFIADIKIDAKDLISESSFTKRLFNQDYNFSLSIVRNDFGQTATIEIKDLSESFKFNDNYLSKNQKDLFLSSQDSKTGFVIINGKENILKKKILYTFLEKESQKEKEVYSIEDSVLHQISFVNQISLSNTKKLMGILSKVLHNKPEVIAVENCMKSSLLALFNYVNFGKKVFLSLNIKSDELINNIFDLNLEKGLVAKNFLAFINIQKFNKLDSKKIDKQFLNKKEMDLVHKFLSDDEIKDIFYQENFKKDSVKGLKKIPFSTKNNKKRFLSLKKEELEEEIAIKSIFNVGNVLENAFLEKLNKIDTKNNINKAIKKSMLENLLLASYRGYIDIKEVILYLTK